MVDVAAKREKFKLEERWKERGGTEFRIGDCVRACVRVCVMKMYRSLNIVHTCSESERYG